MSPKKTTSKTRAVASQAKLPATKKGASSRPTGTLAQSKGKQATAKKVAVGKIAEKTAGKTTVKRPAAKKPALKKAASKKSSMVKAEVKVKAAVKKPLAKKPMAPQSTTKKVAKKVTAKKQPAKLPPATKNPAPKAAAKKMEAKKVAVKTTTKTSTPRSSSSAAAGKPSVKAPAKLAKATLPVSQAASRSAAAASQKPAPAMKADSTTTASRPLKKAVVPVGGDYARFRELLLTLRHRLVGDVSMMSREALGGSDGAADNHAPIHPAEVGTHSFEQEFTLNLLTTDGQRLERIDAALEKVGDGTYGACDECGGRIPRARLEIIPDTPYCVKCASRLEV